MRHILIKIPATPGFPAEEYIIKYPNDTFDDLDKYYLKECIINEYNKLPDDRKSVVTAIENMGDVIFKPDDEIIIELN
jgi:hypothetical protein